MPNEGPASQRIAGAERTPARPRVARDPHRSPGRRPGVDVRLDFSLRVNSYSFQNQLYSFEKPVAGITRNVPHCCGGHTRSGKAGTRATKNSTESGGRGSATRRARLHIGGRGSRLEGEAPLRRRARLRSETTTKDGAPRRGERGSTARRRAPQKLESDAPFTTAESEAPKQLRRARLRLQPQKLEGEAPIANAESEAPFAT